MFAFRILAAAKFIVLLAAVFPADSSDPPNIVLQPITPPPSQCQPFTFQWTGGTPPFFVYLRQDGVPQRSLGPTNGSSFPWDSDFPAGTVLDATVSGSDCSLSKESETFTVQAGPSNDCLGLPLTASSTSSESNIAVPSTDRTTPHTSSPSPSPFARPTSTELTPSSGLKAGTSSTPPPPTDSQSPSASSSHTSAPPIEPRPSAPSTPVPSASAGAQQRPSPGAGKGGRVACIVIGCLLAIALLTALALVLLRKRRRARARGRGRMASMTTSAFTATTRSDLSPPAPEPDRPHGANEGVTEWNADFFARSRSRDTSRTRPPSRVPFAMPTPGARGTGTPPGRPSTRIPKASVDVETSAPVRAAPAESDDDAPSLRSYPPLVPQTRTVSVSAVGGPVPIPGEHAYPPATVPVPVLRPVQSPVNPFRARLLAAAAASNGNGAQWAWSDGRPNGTWARSDGPEHLFK